MSEPELSDPITLRLPVDILREIEQVAEALDRTRSWVMVRAPKRYIAWERHDVLAVIEGWRQIEAGQSFDMDDVLKEIEAIAEAGPLDEGSAFRARRSIRKRDPREEVSI